MRQVINQNDLKNIIGKWVIQLTNEQENFLLTESQNDGFWLEKRISFVGTLYGSDGYPHFKFDSSKESLIILNGLYYTHGIYTAEKFVEYFNYGFESKKERFMRLLTSKELDWLNNHLKAQLY